MKKLFACDFDGTLFNKNDMRHFKSVTDEINIIQSKVNAVVVASGRPLHLLKPHFENFDNMFFISNDGGVFSRGFDILFKQPIDKSKLKEITEKERIDFIAYGQCITYIKVSNLGKRMELDKFFNSHTVNVDSVDEISEDIYKISFFECQKEYEFLDKCWNSYGLTEYVAKGATKGSCLSIVQKALGFSSECTVAIGDGINDISMMEKAGTSYAMVSAPPKVKGVADMVVDDIIKVFRGDFK